MAATINFQCLLSCADGQSVMCVLLSLYWQAEAGIQRTAPLRLPSARGYSFAAWLRFEDIDAPAGTAGRALFSLQLRGPDGNRGVLVHLRGAKVLRSTLSVVVPFFRINIKIAGQMGLSRAYKIYTNGHHVLLDIMLTVPTKLISTMVVMTGKAP